MPHSAAIVEEQNYICLTDISASPIVDSVIRSFKERETERIFGQNRSKRFPPEIQMRALVKLMMIDSAEAISDLTAPPSNRLEKLSGARSEEYSIRINRQWRICFRFENGDAFDVGIEDYH